MMKKKKVDDLSYIKIVISFIILVISIVAIFNSSNMSENVLVSYKTDSAVDYKVYIFQNNFITDEYMSKDKTYITNLVDKIDLTLNYNMSSTDKIDQNTKYDIVATVIVKHDTSGKVLWSENNSLISDKAISEYTDKSISIAESVSIPYNEYNNKIKQFNAQFNIPVTAYVDVNLIVKDASNNNIGSTGVSMDLAEDTFVVKENSTGSNVNDVTEEVKPNERIIIIEGIIIALSGIYLVYQVYLAVNSSPLKKNYYSQAVYKILKNYGDIVAEIVKPIDLSHLKVIDVKNFDQMLDIEEEIRIPILFFETVKREEGWFVIITNDMAYRFILKDKLKY